MSIAQNRADAVVEPLRDWLGVRVPNPNAYQLLKIDELEVDPKIIETAAKRQLAALDGHHGSVDRSIWQEVHQAVELAIEQLSDSEEKQLLDASLRRERSRVAPPADASAVELKCVGCEATNTGGNQFCAQCGRELWTQCISCSHVCPSSQAFCGSCGNNLREAEQELFDRFETALKEAETLAENFEYAKARKLLRTFALLEDPRVTAFCERAIAALHRLRAQESESGSVAIDNHRLAKEQLGDFQYQQALQTLREVPEALCTEEVFATRREVERLVREIQELRAELKARISAKNLHGLGHVLERLSELQPGDQEIAALRVKMHERFVRSAQTCLSRRRYGDAMRFIDEIPPHEHDDKVLKLYEQAKELLWLSDDINGAPVVDEPLIAIAERLAKITRHPDDVEQAKRLKNRPLPKASPCLLPVWNAPQDKSRLAVGWLGRTSRLQVAETIQQWRRHQGVFVTACGLALQAMDAAPISVDLLPRGKGLLGSISRRKKKPPREAWGLDLGSYALKAVKLVRDDADQIQIAASVIVERKQSDHPSRRGQDASELSEAVAALKKQGQIQDEPICMNLANKDVLARFTQLPATRRKSSARELLAMEAKHQFPVDLDELVWDHHVFEELEVGAYAPRAVLLAARRDQVEQVVRAVADGGVKVTAVQGSCFALHNFVSVDQLGWDRSDNQRRLASDRPVAILDVGAEDSQLVVVAPDYAWFYGIPLGGNHFTQKIAATNKLTFRQAQLVKHEPARAARMSNLFAALDPLYAQLQADVRRGLEACHRVGGPQVKQLYGVGGGFRTHRMLRQMQSGG